MSKCGVWRSAVCPDRVRSLQAAELWAAARAIKLAANRGEQCPLLVANSEGSRYALSTGHASGSCTAQKRVLRWLFWLCGWSGIEVGVFRVPSQLNPADPPLRLSSCVRRSVAIVNSSRLLVQWLVRWLMPNHKYLPSFPWPKIP